MAAELGFEPRQYESKSYLATPGENSGDHRARYDNVLYHEDLRVIAAEYDDLYKLSKKARYKCLPILPCNVQAAIEDLNAITKHLDTILPA